MWLLELSNIGVAIEGKRILRSVSLQLAEGQKILIRGASASGKSTLLRAILGGVPLSSGRITFKGQRISAHNIGWLRSQVGYVGQEPVLGADGVGDALMLPFSFKHHRKKAPTAKLIQAVLNRLDLDEEILSQPCNRLSGGEKQRLALARALLLQPVLLLLDEITSALDPKTTHRVVQLLRESDCAIVAVSHYAQMGTAFTTECEVQDGSLRCSKTPGKVE